MIKTSKQLKDLIHNLSKKNAADAQILMRNYMMERFLERILLSEYRDHFVLKGGMLIAAMVGLDTRSTMDMDATMKGVPVNEASVKEMVEGILAVPLDDGVKFRVKRIQTIMEETDYPGVRVSMETEFDGVITPLKVDFSTGDVITPKEVRYRFKLMLEPRFIEVWAYNLETALAEKLESMISRGVTNTRMRDFYDVHILSHLYADQLSAEVFHEALLATCRKRGHLEFLEDAGSIFDEVEQDPVMENLWHSYQKHFSYASGLPWQTVMDSARKLYAIASIN